MYYSITSFTVYFAQMGERIPESREPGFGFAGGLPELQIDHDAARARLVQSELRRFDRTQ